MLLDIKWLQKNRLAFFNVSSPERKTGTSYQNEGEKNEVVEVVKCLFEHGMDLVVLTPYVGQVVCIRSKLQERLSNMLVCTIDAFQGQERDVVVFSSVRSNSKKKLGFIADTRRMNVLLTRAKYAIVGIGCKDTLSNGSDLWKDWLNNTHAITCEDLRSTKCSDKQKCPKQVHVSSGAMGRGELERMRYSQGGKRREEHSLGWKSGRRRPQEVLQKQDYRVGDRGWKMEEKGRK